ncbi:MAG: hypothetical protein RLZ64_1540, partial [Pseudomonadota bacterium]
ITVVALVLYIAFTVSITEWRTQVRRQMNELDSSAHSRAIDSLLNYETVKYFNNESFEARRYDESLDRYRKAAIKSQATLSLLNTGQQMIIAIALVVMLWRATQGVIEGRMSLGDLVMVNAFMIQLYIPLGFLGVIYREIKQSLTDLDKMFRLLEKEREVADHPDAPPLSLPPGQVDVRFEQVDFAYDPARPILHGVSFHIPAGKTVAVVGSSGAGKSTLARCLIGVWPSMRGQMLLDGVDISKWDRDRLGPHIGYLPQDIELLEGTVAENICRFGEIDSDAVIEAAKRAGIHEMVQHLPQGYDTSLGQAGGLLSGGQRQRLALARALYGMPDLVVLDEPNANLDDVGEVALMKAIVELKQAGKTVFMVLHQRNLLALADRVLVLNNGTVAQFGVMDVTARPDALPQPRTA